MQIVVTGATRGIGKAVVEIFAKDTTPHHFFLCARKKEQLTAIAAAIKGFSARHTITTFVCDLQDNTQIRAFGAQILTSGLAVDLLINNAGIYEPGSCYNEPEGQLEKMIQVNLMSE